jgi:hypothetical protein
MNGRTVDALVKVGAFVLFLAFAVIMTINHVESDRRDERLKRALILHELQQKNTVHIYVHEEPPKK